MVSRHVSSSDFFFWWSSSSQLRCLQKSTTGLCPEKNVRLWSHVLNLTNDQHFGQLLASTWCYGQCPTRNFPRLLLVCFWFWRSFVVVRPPTKSSTYVATSHKSRAMMPPFENQHPVKYSLTLLNCEILRFGFWHVQFMGTSVRLPKDTLHSPWSWLKIFKVTSKSASWNRTNLQCWTVLPTWQYCR